MTNLEVIRSLPAEKLAELLVHSGDELSYYDFEVSCDITSDGTKFYDEFDLALEHEIEWLNSECENEQSINIR